jgi:hypothetical protein
MATPYAGADTFPATIDVLDDGDAASASGIGAAAFEALADRTEYLKTRLEMFAGLGGLWSDTGTALIVTSTAPTANYTKVSEVTMASLLPGDHLDVDAGVHVACAGDSRIALGIDVGGVFTIWGETVRRWIGSTSGAKPFHSSTIAIPGVTGTLKVCLFVKADGANDAEAYGPGTLRVRVVRQ